MRFRRRRLAKINIILTNRITSLFAGWLPGFGIHARGSEVGEGLPNSSEGRSSAKWIRHRADLQQPMRVGEERARDSRLVGTLSTGSTPREPPSRLDSGPGLRKCASN